MCILQHVDMAWSQYSQYVRLAQAPCTQSCATLYRANFHPLQTSCATLLPASIAQVLVSSRLAPHFTTTPSQQDGSQMKYKNVSELKKVNPFQVMEAGASKKASCCQQDLQHNRLFISYCRPQCTVWHTRYLLCGVGELTSFSFELVQLVLFHHKIVVCLLCLCVVCLYICMLFVYMFFMLFLYMFGCCLFQAYAPGNLN